VSALTVESSPPLVPLLEKIYETGQVQTEQGDQRSAQPVGVPRAHAVWLAALVSDQGLESTLETGMAYGLSTLAIAGAHAARGAGRHIAIDPTVNGYYEGIGPANVRSAGLADRVRVIAEGSQLALPRLAGEGVQLDFAFIDGMHLFDYALIDFFYVDHMLATGGFVAFHDTWMPAVRDVVDFVATNRRYESVDAIPGGIAAFRKVGPDQRSWTYHRAFAQPRPERRPGEEPGRELFERLHTGAEQAAEASGGFEQRDFVLAGSPIRVRAAGDALAPVMLAALSHARVEKVDAPELEIVMWETATSSVPQPEVPWALGDVRARGDVRGFEGEDVSVFTEPASGSITVFDRSTWTIVYWVVDARVLPWHERGAPLRAALHQWAATRGRHFVHAGAVGADGGGVLLAGASGSGKSTTALACVDAGLEYAGDDYVILTTDGAPRAHCVYTTAKLDSGALERLPRLAAAVVDHRRGTENKAVLDIHAYRPEVVRSSLPVDGIVVPVVGRSERLRVRRASAAEALRALAPTTLLQLPGAAQERMRAMAGLVRSVPALAIDLGTDMSEVPDAIARICADPAAAYASAEGGT
jgi:predicted O-methyltransferase YrrM